MTETKCLIFQAFIDVICVVSNTGGGIKLYLKESLVKRIQFELSALLPSECMECKETYTVEFEPVQKPVFQCHMCFRGSHNCPAVTDFYNVLSSSALGRQTSLGQHLVHKFKLSLL